MIPVTDLDPVIEFGADEQTVSGTDKIAEVPVEMSRVSSEVVTLTYRVEGAETRGGSISFPEGVREGTIKIEIGGKSSSEIQIEILKTTFSKLGSRLKHTIKVTR